MTSQSIPEKKKAPSYGIVFLILGVFTTVEVGVSYLPEGLKIPILIFLALVKASLVALYFMHLRSDSRLYAMFFVVGLVLIIPIVLILTAVMPALR
jgi:cytochrome c oxidase subunit 4